MLYVVRYILKTKGIINKMGNEYENFKNEVEENKLIPLSITNSIVEYGSTTYPVRNISHIKLVEKTILSEEKMSGLVAFLYLMGLVGIFFYGIGIILLIIAWFSDRSRNKDIRHVFYGLSLETNSGSSDLFFDEDKSFIVKIKDLITKAIANNENINQEVHIGDKNFIDNSTTNNHAHFEIKVDHHHGLSETDKEFITGDFKRNLEDLNTELIRMKDADKSMKELSKIVEEVNSDNPNPSTIKKYWESFKTITEGYDTLTTATDFGIKVGAVASMFLI